MVTFMLAHMTIVLNKTGTIAFGSLIKSIARALNLDNEISTLTPPPPCIINFKFLKDMKLCKVRREGGFDLMVHGITIPSVVFSCIRRTDVREERNWTYDLNAPPLTGPMPPNIPFGDGHETEEEYNRQNQSPDHPVSPHHVSPVHTAPSSSHFPAGIASDFHFTEDM